MLISICSLAYYGYLNATWFVQYVNPEYLQMVDKNISVCFFSMLLWHVLTKYINMCYVYLFLLAYHCYLSVTRLVQYAIPEYWKIYYPLCKFVPISVLLQV